MWVCSSRVICSITCHECTNVVLVLVNVFFIIEQLVDKYFPFFPLFFLIWMLYFWRSILYWVKVLMFEWGLLLIFGISAKRNRGKFLIFLDN